MAARRRRDTVTVEEEALRRLQEAEDDRLDALDRRDREGEKAPAAEALFGGVSSPPPRRLSAHDTCASRHRGLSDE
jgi:hypothetical protein